MGKVLIIGAGGLFGRHIAPLVLARGGKVRGLVRHADGAAVAREAGVEDIVTADLHDEAALRDILREVSGVFYLPPKFLPDEAAVGVRLVELAAQAGVGRFVLSGVIHPFLTGMVNHCSKLPVQEALVKSGMCYTMLQPTNFMQSIGEFFWPAVLATGEYVIPGNADRQMCWVDYRDVAEVAAIALTSDELAWGVFELSAAGMVTREDIGRMMSKVLGRTVGTRRMSVDEWVEQNTPPHPVLRAGFRGIGEFYGQYGLAGGNDLVLHTILGRPPRTLEAYIAALPAVLGTS